MSDPLPFFLISESQYMKPNTRTTKEKGERGVINDKTPFLRKETEDFCFGGWQAGQIAKSKTLPHHYNQIVTDLS